MLNQKSTFTFRLLFGVFSLCTAVHFLFCESINQFRTQQAASSLSGSSKRREKARGRPSGSALSSIIQASRNSSFWCVTCLTKYFVWFQHTKSIFVPVNQSPAFLTTDCSQGCNAVYVTFPVYPHFCGGLCICSSPCRNCLARIKVMMSFGVEIPYTCHRKTLYESSQQD